MRPKKEISKERLSVNELLIISTALLKKKEMHPNISRSALYQTISILEELLCYAGER